MGIKMQADLFFVYAVDVLVIITLTRSVLTSWITDVHLTHAEPYLEKPNLQTTKIPGWEPGPGHAQSGNATGRGDPWFV